MNRHATNYHPECERARAHPSSHCPHDSLPRMNANEYIRKTSSVDPGTRSRNSDIVVSLQMSVTSLSVRTESEVTLICKDTTMSEMKRLSCALDIGAGSPR